MDEIAKETTLLPPCYKIQSKKFRKKVFKYLKALVMPYNLINKSNYLSYIHLNQSWFTVVTHSRNSGKWRNLRSRKIL